MSQVCNLVISRLKVYASVNAAKQSPYCRLWDWRSLQWSNRSVRWATNHQLLRAMLQRHVAEELVNSVLKYLKCTDCRHKHACGLYVLYIRMYRWMCYLQSLMTWWMSNSKAASKMLSRGSGTLLESRNMVMHDCTTHTHAHTDSE